MDKIPEGIDPCDVHIAGGTVAFSTFMALRPAAMKEGIIVKQTRTVETRAPATVDLYRQKVNRHRKQNGDGMAYVHDGEEVIDQGVWSTLPVSTRCAPPCGRE